MQSVQELQENLNTYREQRQQVDELLHAEPENSEYKEMRDGLIEVIELTEDLLRTALQAESSSVVEPGVDYEPAPAAPEPAAPTTEAEPASEEERRPGDILAEAQKEAEAARLALKRKVSEAARKEIQSKDIPEKLKIKPDDSEDVKLAKRKKVHAIKSKQRLENLELAQNKKQNTWNEFQTKGKVKKAGFFTGRKKESIFKSPEDLNGKVGVVGSGHGMTDFQKRGKHLNLKVAQHVEED